MAPDGRILALAGRRAASPSGGLDGESDPTLALDVWAPAASVFKIATSAALVRAGVSPTERVCYHGGVRSVMESNLVDDRRDRACQDLRYGLAHSQNAILGKLAYQRLTPTTLGQAAADLGFAGQLDGWVLAGPRGEVELPPTNDLGFAKAAAGFSGSYLSVVGGAVMTNSVATGGLQAQPQLIAEVWDERGASTPVSPVPPSRVLEADVAAAVADMMEATCRSGSAARSFASLGRDPSRAVAGKTGTLAQDEPYYMEYSWFVGFSPAVRPEVTFAVLIGNAADWWMKAHTAARELLDRARGRGPTG